MGDQHEEYRGNHIELRTRPAGEELLLNDEPLVYRQLPDGRYLLDCHAYEWDDDLAELARRLVDYRERVAALAHGTAVTG